MKPSMVGVGFWFSCWALSCAAFDQKAAQPDVEAMKRRLLDRDMRLHAVALEYREVERGGAPVGAPGEYIRRAIAANTDGCFLRDNSHGHDGLHWTDDPFRKTLLICPRGWKLLSHVNRVIHDGPPLSGAPVTPDSLYAEVGRELILRSLCWWPFQELPPPNLYGRSICMKRLFEDRRYTVRANREVVNGRECVVMEVPGVDAFYVDAARPPCVLRRDLWNTDTASVASRFEYGAYTRYGEDIWLPGSVRNIQFDANAHTAAARHRRVVDSLFIISNVLVNGDVGASQFELNIPPGTVRGKSAADGEQGRYYFEALSEGQDAHFRSIVEWIKRMRFFEKMPVPHQSARYRDGVAACLGFAATWLVLSRKTVVSQIVAYRTRGLHGRPATGPRAKTAESTIASEGEKR